MKNIFKIFISDVKRIFQNVVAVVVIMGLCVIPCLYAWFNIFSNWDPYGESSTSNLKVAVVSEDEGVTVAGISVNIGSSVVEALQENKVMGWVFTETSDEAVDGVYSGEYYAALVIPDDFTEEMISFLGGQIEHPDIMGMLVIGFYNTEYIQSFVSALGAKNALLFILAFVGVNGLVEAIVCFVVGTAISAALKKALKYN